MQLFVHCLLAIVLFFLQNWIGARAYSRGYVKFSLLDEKDEALSINFVIKVFGSTVFLIIIVATLQYFELNQFIPNIINVIYFYLILRVLAIVLYERILVVNWWRILLYYSLILWFSTLIYSRFITKIEDLLPDFSQIKNEIWILIIVFIYQIGNKIGQEDIKDREYEIATYYFPELKRRKKRYILRKHNEFYKDYYKIINKISNNNDQLRELILAIILFENFNRPRFIRILERIKLFILGTKTSIGIMQINSTKNISDIESVKIGTNQLFAKYSSLSIDPPYNIYKRVIKSHCPDKRYISEVLFILKAVIDNKYSKEKETTYKEIFSEIIDEFGLND